MKRRQKGMSLVELLVVVGMIGVIALVTVPAMLQLMPQYRIRSAASELSAALRYARQKALGTRVPWKVSFDSTKERYAYAQYIGTTVTDAGLATTANWQNMKRDGLKAGTSYGDLYWMRFSTVDLNTSTTNAFKDSDCDGYKEVIFLRDGSVKALANGGGCGGGSVLSFISSPTVVLRVDNNWVKYNRYYIAIASNGRVSVTPAKE
jgi:prepilin-type N-terminal cleavage/methylation domain-containing protein